MVFNICCPIGIRRLENLLNVVVKFQHLQQKSTKLLYQEKPTNKQNLPESVTVLD